MMLSTLHLQGNMCHGKVWQLFKLSEVNMAVIQVQQGHHMSPDCKNNMEYTIIHTMLILFIPCILKATSTINILSIALFFKVKNSCTNNSDRYQGRSQTFIWVSCFRRKVDQYNGMMQITLW